MFVSGLWAAGLVIVVLALSCATRVGKGFVLSCTPSSQVGVVVHWLLRAVRTRDSPNIEGERDGYR